MAYKCSAEVYLTCFSTIVSNSIICQSINSINLRLYAVCQWKTAHGLIPLNNYIAGNALHRRCRHLINCIVALIEQTKQKLVALGFMMFGIKNCNGFSAMSAFVVVHMGSRIQSLILMKSLCLHSTIINTLHNNHSSKHWVRAVELRLTTCIEYCRWQWPNRDGNESPIFAVISSRFFRNIFVVNGLFNRIQCSIRFV